ncbi:MAG TPA: ATP-binding protein [Opitutaceae bacterium]|jgi:hypothetical protein|nr:ATP-binding protein [Opitutaceae bacterium]
MKLQLGPEVISSYKRLAYEAWYALAEFVDNSTQSYFNNRARMDKIYAKNRDKLTVKITIGRDKNKEFIRIEDNSIGMSEAELKNAVYIGKLPIDTMGRSRYGLGLKTGACWFGDLWTIETKKLDDTTWHKISVNVPAVAGGAIDLPHKKKRAAAGEHKTIIEIRKLHRKITGRTLGKVKTHLRSLYRRDISKNQLVLMVNGEILSWDADIDKRLLTRANGSKAKRTFRFKVGGKTVSGWAGVLEKGSRKDAGFSIIQSDRVIKGWPESYRPVTLYGDQEGGSNDLVNQRLFGELVLEGFEVSHTKDQILFDDGDQEMLELKLKDKLAELRQLAKSHRKDADERVKAATDDQRNAALNRLEKEMELKEMQDFMKTFEIPSNSLIQKSNESVKNAIVKKTKPNLKATINKTVVSVYLVKDMSPNDPYVIIESTKSETSIIVIINLVHPHWSQLTQEESILNFIRHCTYDGVSESKAYFVTGKIEPDTVKLIKDNLLRIPMNLQGT